MKLSDLSEKDRESLMQEMRLIVEQENIAKNATSMYAMKKKELVEKEVGEIVHILRLKQGPDKSKCRNQFIGITNYLLNLNSPEKQNNNSKIKTAAEWETFQNICTKVKECMVHCVKTR